MSGTDPLKIPYRLENPEDIREAARVDLLGMGARYRAVLRVAARTTFPIPRALRAARREVRRSFCAVRENTLRELRSTYEEIADLGVVENFSLIEQRLPWTREVARHEDVWSFLSQFAPAVRSQCGLDPPPRTLTAQYASNLAIRRLAKRELLGVVRAKRPTQLTTDELARLLVAACLFSPENGDVLHALRLCDRSGSGETLYQHALAELLFSRLPQAMAVLFRVESAPIRRKLHPKLASLGMSARQRINLCGYFASDVDQAGLGPVLEKMEAVAQHMLLPEPVRQKVRDYVRSLRRSVARASRLYEELFLGSRELEQMRRLHVPGKVMRSTISYRDRVVRTRTRVEELVFYPTKDYLDLCRGKRSADCLDVDQSEAQLKVRHSFNIRIFRQSSWIGNIYMLDFTEEQGVLLVDRIQIPRELHVPYLRFFDDLREALRQMFAEATYERILVPLTVSNHAAIQRAFNGYRSRLPKAAIRFDSRYADHFESLGRHRSYYVLCDKGATVGRSRADVEGPPPTWGVEEA